MKLISLNMEGNSHLDRVQTFLQKESPDVIALMEVPENMCGWLQEQGYQTSFVPMTIRTQNDTTFTEGILLASKTPHTSSSHYYRRDSEKICAFDSKDKFNTCSHAILFAEIGAFNIATTHFTWNPVGEIADELQKKEMQILLEITRKLPVHILCGDMNIPRNCNELYETLCKHYTDNIPSYYQSSLDRTLHWRRDDPTRAKLFDDFMVDYVFTQPPYAASDVRLQFGISDHAAVVAHLSISDT
jgi:endonuclease/exonuclease/phosphatase family metal-dependent hydrolase